MQTTPTGVVSRENDYSEEVRTLLLVRPERWPRAGTKMIIFNRFDVILCVAFINVASLKKIFKIAVLLSSEWNQ